MKTRHYIQPPASFRPTKIAVILGMATLLTGYCLDATAEVIQHNAHQHGAARLTVVSSETGLEIVLESPAANLFGIEYHARTDEEHEIVHEAVEKLHDANALFQANASASCQSAKTHIESTIADHHNQEKHDDHDKHKEHDKHDDHDKHKEHDKHDDHDKHTTHSDVTVSWHLNCAAPDQLETVAVNLFSAFPNGFEKLSVDWISATGEGSLELTENGTVQLQ